MGSVRESEHHQKYEQSSDFITFNNFGRNSKLQQQQQQKQRLILFEASKRRVFLI
jgi:hypothetical protein